MSNEITVHGRFAGRAFIPAEPLPDVAGSAELVITPTTHSPSRSIFDLFGTAPALRTGQDIAAQIREEREGWDES